MQIEIPAGMSNLAMWTAIVAFFAPVVLDLIIQSKWPARLQAVVAFAASAVIGVVTAWLSGAFNGVGIVTGILLAFVVTITAYKGFWQHVTPNLKAATSAGGANPVATTGAGNVSIEPGAIVINVPNGAATLPGTVDLELPQPGAATYDPEVYTPKV